jgi:hypothetical protein
LVHHLEAILSVHHPSPSGSSCAWLQPNMSTGSPSGVLRQLSQSQLSAMPSLSLSVMPLPKQVIGLFVREYVRVAVTEEENDEVTETEGDSLGVNDGVTVVEVLRVTVVL